MTVLGASPYGHSLLSERWIPVRRIVAISLVLVGTLFVSVPEASAAVVTHKTVRWTSGHGWVRAGYYCDFMLRSGTERIVGRYTFVHQDGHLVRSIDHEVRRGTYINARTGAVVTTLSRYTISFRRGKPLRVTGALMKVRAADGTLLLSSSGMALIDFIRDSYVFLKRTKHATMIDQFTEYPPGVCEMLGGHQVVD